MQIIQDGTDNSSSIFANDLKQESQKQDKENNNYTMF